MEAPAFRNQAPPFSRIEFAANVIRHEAGTLDHLAGTLDASFCRALELIQQCPANVIVSGMGKAGLIGQKITATLASTGTCAHFVHPAEAVHGDLGRIRRRDVLIILSQSGSTAEILDILPSLKSAGASIIAITGNPHSPLGLAAEVVLQTHADAEACPLGLAPSSSTTAMLALGDALALTLSRLRDFQPDDFARFHPGGSLGRKLSRVEEAMRPLSACRITSLHQSVRDVLVACSQPGRRTGAIMLCDAGGQLRGIFTDSDLARIFERKQEHLLDRPIADVMTPNPHHVRAGTRLTAAIETMSELKLSELPVVEGTNRPIGLLDITDLGPAASQPPQPEEIPSNIQPGPLRFRVFDNPSTQSP